MAGSIFIDKKKRRITIEEEGDVFALHNGAEVGRIEIESGEDGPKLWSMSVEDDYQRAGIATEMMKLVAKMYGKDIGKPDSNAEGGSNAQSADYYTEEGAAFISSCVEKGILVNTDFVEGPDKEEFDE